MKESTKNIIGKIIRGDIETGILSPEACEKLTQEEAEALCRDEYNGKKVLYYIYDNKNIKGPEDNAELSAYNLDVIHKREILCKLCEKYAATSLDIAEFACYSENYATLFQNETFLLSKKPGEKRTRLDDAVEYFERTLGLYLMLNQELTGEILGHKLVDYNNIYLIELLVSEFGIRQLWEKLSKHCLTHQLDNGMTILEFLISKDTTIAAEMINKMDLTLDDAIIIKILLQQGFKFNIRLGEKETVNLVGSLIYEDLETVGISPEEEARLTYFKELFMKDEKSDEAAIILVYQAYREQILLKSPHAMRDLDSLINIKTKFPNFSLRIIDSRKKENIDKVSYFSGKEAAIFLTLNASSFTINHELGHALHYYSSTNYTTGAPSFIVPDGFDRFRNLTDEQLRKINVCLPFWEKEIAKRRGDIYESLRQARSSEENAPLNKEDFYQSLKKEVRQAMQEKEYQPGLMEYISEHLLNQQEYADYFKTNIINTLQAVMLNQQIHFYGSISDIIDALSKGKFYGCQITIEGKILIPPSGHGRAYYSREGRDFEEILAQYIAIIKSKESSRGIEILTDILGKEFVDFFKNYYENLIVYEGGKRAIWTIS